MIRTTSFLAFSMLATTLCAMIGAASLANRIVAPRPVYDVNRLDAFLTIRFRSDSAEELVRRVAPQFIFHGRDLLWIEHDATGKIGFAMNRVYHLRIGNANPQYYLIEAAKGYGWPDRCGESFRFTQAVDADAIVVARDSRRGVVYQARWSAAPETGSGGWTQTRNIFLLCDGKHRWHLLGEGPSTMSGALAADDIHEQSIEPKAAWTGDADHPVTLSYTLLDTERWDRLGDDVFGKSLTIRWDMTPGKPDTEGLVDGIDPADVDCFQRGKPYLIASRSEPFADLASRIADCSCGHYPGKSLDQQRAWIAKTTEILRRANPELKDTISAGRKIILPKEIPLFVP